MVTRYHGVEIRTEPLWIFKHLVDVELAFATEENGLDWDVEHAYWTLRIVFEDETKWRIEQEQTRTLTPVF